jgi:large subunit ribosomal protein L25
MKQISLSGTLREGVGRTGAKELRLQERVPGVLYGGTEQVHFHVSEMDLSKIRRQAETFQINLEVNGKTYPTVIQEIQSHPVTDRVRHIDLLELIPGKVVKVALPVRVSGNSEGVRAGGKLMMNYRKVRISGLPDQLPEAIELDITPLKIGDMIRVRDIKIEGCKFHEADASAVVTVQATRASIAAETGATDDKKKK